MLAGWCIKIEVYYSSFKFHRNFNLQTTDGFARSYLEENSLKKVSGVSLLALEHIQPCQIILKFNKTSLDQWLIFLSYIKDSFWIIKFVSPWNYQKTYIFLMIRWEVEVNLFIEIRLKLEGRFGYNFYVNFSCFA